MMEFKRNPSKMNLKKICLFCGSRAGLSQKWLLMARELGEKIGSKKWEVIYGGGRWGLMGEIAETAAETGSKVTGIITEELLKLENTLQEIDELIIVRSMAERKTKMIKISDIFLVLPGGIGTLDELFEVWTTKQLKQHSKTIIILNFENYYDSLFRLIKNLVAEGFLVKPDKDSLIICQSVDEVISEISKNMLA